MDDRPEPERAPAVDYRFLLANERTFLAYVRTALSFDVAGLGVLQFLTHGHSWVRYVLGLVLVSVGSLVGLVGQRRFRRNEAAIRQGRDLPRSPNSSRITYLVAALPVVAAVLLVVASST